MRKSSKFLLILLFISLCTIPFAACGGSGPRVPLDTPENLEIDMTQNMLTWDAVPNAKEYNISIYPDEGYKYENDIQTTSYVFDVPFFDEICLSGQSGCRST